MQGQTKPQASSATNVNSRAFEQGSGPAVDLELHAPLKEVAPHEYCVRHVDARLTTVESIGLQRLYLGLRDRKLQFRDGLFINRSVDALRWVLEQLGSADLPAPSGESETRG